MEGRGQPSTVTLSFTVGSGSDSGQMFALPVSSLDEPLPHANTDAHARAYTRMHIHASQTGCNGTGADLEF